jgi:predicted RNase H-like nuclease (RuvC/YqgF family)
MAKAGGQDKVRVVFTSIVERIADYERRLAEYEAKVRALKTELAKYKKMNENLKTKLNNHQAVCKKCKLKTAALAEQLYQYNRLTDELLKVVKNPRVLRVHGKKRK